MNAVVLYATRSGNTRRVAEAIADGLRSMATVEVASIDAAPVVPARTDLVVIGGPTEGRHMTPPLADFLAQLPHRCLEGVATAAFDTRLDWPRWLAGSAAEGIRHELERKGARTLHAALRARDPAAAARVAPTDSQRIVRTLELLDAGAPLPTGGENSQLWTQETRRPTLLAGVVMERSALYARIDARVEAMVRAGAREEVERAVAAGASAGARQALGFQELLDGDVERMKQRTRNYAKRQLTWMRKLPGVMLLDATDSPPDALAARLHDELSRRDEADGAG